MAVRANRTQIFDRIDKVFLPNVRKGLEMVDMDEAIRELAICSAKIKIAHYARRTVTLDAAPPCSQIALEPIDRTLLNCALRISLA